MSTRTKLWLVPALLYAAFCIWYTDLGGPLSDAEVDEFVAAMNANGGDPEVIAFVEEFARQDSGRQPDGEQHRLERKPACGGGSRAR